MKLILDEARLLGNELNLDFLHLGGGVGGSDDDSLYKFKSGFSDYNFIFKIWRLIVNQDLYITLVNDKNVPIVLVTHEVIEKNIIDALKDIEKLEVVKGKIIKIRIEELES